MSATFDEHSQFVNSAGVPIVNGLLYIGTVNLDPVPVGNHKAIFSDSDLTAALANPQTLDANGRATNKIWLSGRYSMQVNNAAAVQQYQELDNGTLVEAGLTALSNVLGTNTITADTVDGITAYTDQELFVFKAANTITGAVTLNIDGVGAKAIVRNFDQALFAGQFVQNQIVMVAYNSSNDNFEWQDQNLKVAYDNKGADIVSASTVDLATATGNSVDITGSTGPISSFGTTPAGTIFILQFDSTPTITHNATSLIIPGGASITMVASDQILVQSLGSGNNRIQVFRATGRALVETTTGIVQVLSASNSGVLDGSLSIPYDDTIPQQTEGLEVETLLLTPTAVGNLLIITCQSNISSDGTTSIVGSMALFNDSTANALASVSEIMSDTSATLPSQLNLRHIFTATDTIPTTFKIRVGPTSGDFTVNGANGVRRMGGVYFTRIDIMEYNVV